jgi:hypothetical protein
MVSLQQLWEQIENRKKSSPLMGGDDNRSVMAVLKAGRDLHHDNQTPFWDELISLCKNPEGLSSLLGVSREQIASWPTKIKKGLEDLRNQSVNSPEEKQNKKMIPTGMNGAVTTNQDPNLGEML